MRWLVAAVAGALIAPMSPVASALPVAAATLPAPGARVGASAALPDGIGYYNPDDGTFHLRNQVLSSGPSDYAYQFGPVGGVIALAGDWDGDGRDGIGYYNVADATFHLRNDATRPGRSDYAFKFGPVGGVIPLAGDWDGDGRAGIGYYDLGDSTVHLRNSVQTLGPSNYAHRYAIDGPVEQFLTGDWVGTGRDGLADSYPNCDNACPVVPWQQVDIRYDARTAGPFDESKMLPYRVHDPLAAGDWDGDGIDSLAILDNGTITICEQYPPPANCVAPLGPPNPDYVVQLVAGRWH